MLNILMIAEESAGMRLLRNLADRGHRIVGVVCTQDSPSSGQSSVWSLARKLDLRTWPADIVAEPAFPGVILEESVDLLLNVHSLHILPRAVLEAPRMGCFNLHPGPLPEYSGLNAPSWAIFNGETRHAVTVHAMEPGIDTGPVVYSASFDIEKSASALAVAGMCVKLGVPLVVRLVETAARDPRSIPSTPQDLSRRRYFGREVPHDGWIPWSQSARTIVNFVRACDYHPFPSPWGHPRTLLEGREIGIARASLLDEPPGGSPGTVVARFAAGVKIACCDAAVLASYAISEGRLVPAAELLQPGQQLTDRGRPRSIGC